MAPETQVAKLFAHIAACHNVQLPAGRLPFFIGSAPVGYVLPNFAARLTAQTPAVRLAAGRVTLAAAQADRLNEIATAAGCRFRAEDFDVREAVGGPVLAVLDRGALPDFGVIGVGVHVNGLVRRADGVHLWVGKRAADKKLEPGKLDHLVAGGVPAGLDALQTLIKEGEEEAGLPAVLARRAVAVARFDYTMARPEGLRRDVVFAYDLELPESFVPAPLDGEVEFFELWPLPRVLRTLCETDDFKFNVTLVLIDLLIRKGFISGADAGGLRAALSAK